MGELNLVRIAHMSIRFNSNTQRTYLLLLIKITTMSTSANKKFITREPGQCIVFNLVKAQRVKKRQDVKRMKGEEGGDGGEEEEVISASWMNEDDDNYLIIRLQFSQGRPWLVAHHGVFEIIKAPLFVPIVDSNNHNTTNRHTLTLFLRDSANRRKGSYIQRKFYLQFASFAEAQSFKTAHNLMLTKVRSETERVALEEKKELRKKRKKESSKKDEDNGGEGEKDEKEGDATREPPMKKKRAEIDRTEVDGSKSGEEDDKELGSLGAKIEFEERMEVFVNGDAFIDVPDTQPLFPDDSDLFRDD
jgi:hypothetical protein